jgi:hypothetical protein
MRCYEAPAFVEIKMDAEIGSYQDEFGPFPNTPVCHRLPERSEPASSAPQA